MAFLDEREDAPTPEKEGIYYVKEDPDLGKIRGLDPWAVENGIHLIRMEKDAAEGIMMIRKSNQQQYGTVHGGMLVAFADTIAGGRRRGPTSSAGQPRCRWGGGSAWCP